jgi:hypothetical protein
VERRAFAKDRVEGLRVHRGDARGVKMADPTAKLGGAAESLLDRDLLIEGEADQERERIAGEQPIGFIIAGEREAVGGGGHAGMVRAAAQVQEPRAMACPVAVPSD